MSSKAILVTGGAGYIGSHICKALAQNGYLPITLDNLSMGEEKRVLWGPLINGNIFDTELIQKICSEYKPVGMIHLAACADVRESMRNPGKYYHNNVHGTRALMHAIENSTIETCILSSSCSVYGIPEKCPIDESTPTHPISPYGESKLLAEMIVQTLAASYGMNYGILRYFNASGCDPEHEIGEIIYKSPRIMAQSILSILQEKPLPLYGMHYDTPDGSVVRDFIHVTDLADAHVRMLKDQDSAVLNIGTGKGHSMKEIIQGLEALSGKKIQIEEHPPNPGDPPLLYTGAEKARALGWEPKYSDLDTILKTSWEFACSQN